MFHTIQNGSLEYSVADCLEGSVHCFSTRLGGVSEGYLASLNLGLGRGDSVETVTKNYEILGHAVGFAPEQTVFSKQEHTDVIRVVDQSFCGEGLQRPVSQVCDGQITNVPGVALVTFSADCTPILLFDPVKKAIGAVHAGWRGTAMGIAAKAVDAMVENFGCCRDDIMAAIGPCISKCCFETDADVPEALAGIMGNKASTAFTEVDGKYYVDLKFCNGLILQKAGIGGLDISPDCTKCQPDRYWSHRATGSQRGSQIGLIMLK